MVECFYFMPERKDFIKQEKDIIERSYSTAANFRIVSHYIRFPSVVSGLRILDIGAGASPAILELKRRGARALAYDVRYRNLEEVKDSVEKVIADPSYSARQENRKREEEIFSELGKELPAGVNRDLWSLSAQMAQVSMNQANEEYFNIQRSSLKIFLEAAKNGEMPCVAGTATDLPFKDKSFDFIYSLQAVSQFLLENREVFMQSVSEALRVLKTDGQLQLHPWAPNPYSLQQSPARQSMVALMRFLKERNMPYRIEQFHPFSSPRIVVFKK